MLLAVPALHVPGRSVTCGVVILLATAAGIASLATAPASRPPLSAVLAPAGVLLLALVPFIAAGHGGILGVSFNNDMAGHLSTAEAFGSQAATDALTLNDFYPIGPHALVAAMSHTLGFSTESAFTGVSIAAVLLLAWSALAVLRGLGALASLTVATVAGMPFLVAGYYGQGAFKETLMAALAVAALGELGIVSGRWGAPVERRELILRWVPMGLILGGVMSVYSLSGVAWPGALLAGAAAVALARRIASSGLRSVPRALRPEVPGLAVAGGILFVVLVPQLARIDRFYGWITNEGGDGFTRESLGNLAGRLPLNESLGIWGSPDLRFASPDLLGNELWAGFVLLLVGIGLVWSLARGDWLLPIAALVALVLWIYADSTESPYVSAKTLVILSPFLLLLAVRPMAERGASSAPAWPWWRVAAPVLALVLVVKVVGSSLDALRFSHVGATAHLAELRDLRDRVGTDPTLFLGNDDFIGWEMAPAHVSAPVAGIATGNPPLRAEKAWEYGNPLDFDSVTAATLNAYRWVIIPSGSDGSSVPDGLKAVQHTRDYTLYERVGEVADRTILAEGPAASAGFDCTSPEGRALVRRGGTAAVRTPSISVAVPALGPGSSATVDLPLAPGTWKLDAPYTSDLSIEVTGSGIDTTLVPNLDRPGTRWPIGEVTVPESGTAQLTFRTADTWLSPSTSGAAINAVIATPPDPVSVVPIRRACGKPVDWLQPG
ncbi:MAG: hypothetical protein ACJ762_05320 [Solirubrobacteraceae bacterium]